MDTRTAATIVIGAGVLAILIGVLILLGGLNWFGKLPGDIRIQTENTRIYFPITSMILISVGLTVLLNIIRRIF